MLIQEDLIRFCRFLIPPEASVLAIGPGAKELLPELRPARSFALDLEGEALGSDFEVAERKDEKYDFILLIYLLPRLKDIQDTLVRLRRRTHPGTRLVILNPNYLWVPFLSVLGLSREKLSREK